MYTKGWELNPRPSGLITAAIHQEISKELTREKGTSAICSLTSSYERHRNTERAFMRKINLLNYNIRNSVENLKNHLLLDTS